jgi:hypothetical protein
MVLVRSCLKSVRTERSEALTESEWNTCNEPQAMLEFLAKRGVSERKLRLFACGCVRRVWSLLTDERSQRGIDLMEMYADGLLGQEEWHAASNAAFLALSGLSEDQLYAAQAAAHLTLTAPYDFVVTCSYSAHPDGYEAEKAVQCQLLRLPTVPRGPPGPGVAGSAGRRLRRADLPGAVATERAP